MTPGTTAPVRHGRVVVASVVAVGALLAAASVVYWQWTRPTVPIEPPRPAVEATVPAPEPLTPPTVPAPERPAPSGVEGPRANEQQLATLRATARRQLTAGRPQEALDTISAGLVLDSSDAELRGLVDDLAGRRGNP